MTLADARTDLIAQAGLDLDLYKGITLDSQGKPREEAIGATDLISRACVWWASLTYWSYNPAVTLTLTVPATSAAAIYDCRDRAGSAPTVSERILRPRSVMIDASTLYRAMGAEYGFWTLGELRRYRPSWRSLGLAKPTAAVWMPQQKLLLSAGPDQAYSNCFIEGWTLPDDLVVGEDDDAELPGPSEDHDAIIRYAAAFGALPFASESEAWQRLTANEGFWRERADRRKAESMAAFLGNTPRGSQPDWIRG